MILMGTREFNIQQFSQQEGESEIGGPTSHFDQSSEWYNDNKAVTNDFSSPQKSFKGSAGSSIKRNAKNF